MKRRALNDTAASPKAVRCAVYTRKSTEDGLDQEFNSLDAQREAGESFVRSQAGEGWALLPDRYDDGGYSGGTADRPALTRLLADVEAGRVDCVVVYKVDRLSRSLLDFARMMAVFEKHGVSFVSVTQQFNTATSMGRLVLNVLLSFAQFEREIIAERTRDKIAATRRKGKWAGGRPPVGYDVDPATKRLVVNPGEAEAVRAVFASYLAHRSLLPVVEEAAARGWTSKRRAGPGGEARGGRPFDRTSLYRLLTNVTYAGKVRYKDEVHPGEHAAVVDPADFDRVQDLLRRNGSTGGAAGRTPSRALLQGLLRCGPCGCAMTPTHTGRAGKLRYRYYVCSAAQKNGRATCPTKSVPAEPLERFVVDRIKAVGRDPELLDRVLAEARAAEAARVGELDAERKALEADLRGWHAEVRRLSTGFRPGGDNGDLVTRLAELHARIDAANGKVEAVRERIRAVGRRSIPAAEAAGALAAFEPAWATLTPAEQARVLRLLVARVEYDGSDGRAAVSFRPTGLKALADELTRPTEDVA